MEIWRAVGRFNVDTGMKQVFLEPDIYIEKLCVP